MVSDRWFTPDTARQALDRLRPAAERMCSLVRALEERVPPRVVSDQRVAPAYFALLERLRDAVEEIRAAGGQVKDPRSGLVDFPARRAGRTVLLCWQVGEPSLAYWHEPAAGFAGRRPLDDGPWDER